MQLMIEIPSSIDGLNHMEHSWLFEIVILFSSIRKPVSLWTPSYDAAWDPHIPMLLYAGPEIPILLHQWFELARLVAVFFNDPGSVS